VFGAVSFTVGVSGLTSFLASAEEESNPQGATGGPAGTPKSNRRRSEKTVKIRDLEADHFDFVIVGGGTAAFAALTELKANNAEGTIAIISNESTLPYDRPLLSKDLWYGAPDVGNTLQFRKSDTEFESIIYEQNPEFWNGQVYTFLDTEVLDIEASKKFLLLSDDSVISYGKCLLATGSRPLPLTVPHPKTDRITTFTNVKDFQNLERIARDPSVKHITIIGGSQYTPELAVGVLQRGKGTDTKVSFINPDAGILSRYLPDYLSETLSHNVQGYGVDVKNNTSVVSVDDDLTVRLSTGETFKTDHIVVDIGSAPNVEFAAKTKLELDPIHQGFVCNSQLKIVSGLWAAGDIASYYDPTHGRHRVAYHEHAYYSGKTAARNMLGKRQSYFIWPQFNGKVLEDEFTALGRIDSNLETVGVWLKGPTDRSNAYETEHKHAQGLVYYMADQKIVGVLLWNFLDEHIHDGAWHVLGLTERAYPNPSDVVRAIPFEPKAKEDRSDKPLLAD